MSNYIFTFSIHTDNDVLRKIVFSADGEIIGRIVGKFVSEMGAGVTYDVEATKEAFERIKSGEIKLWGIEKYHVSSSSTSYRQD